MRAIALVLITAFSLMAVPAIAQAAPIAPSLATAAAAPEALQVRDGCGRGFYLRRWQDRWGRWHRRCVPQRGWDRPRPPRHGGPGGYYYR